MKRLVLAALFNIALTFSTLAQGWFPLADTDSSNTHTACSTTSGTVTTFTAAGIGSANPNRIAVATINWSDSTSSGSAEITAVTIASVSASRAVRAQSHGQNSNSEIWWALVPTGTSGNVVVTTSAVVDAMTIAIYRLVGYNSLGPYNITTGTTSISLAYTNKAVALAAGSRTTNVSTSLSNLTNDFSSACGSNLWGVHASKNEKGNGTQTSAISPTTNNPKIAFAYWSPQPSVITSTAVIAMGQWGAVMVNSGITSRDVDANAIMLNLR